MSDAENKVNEATNAEPSTTPLPQQSAPAASAAPEAPASAGSQPAKKGKGPIIAIIVVVIVAIIGIAAWAIISQSGGFYDSSAQSGQAPYKTDEEKQAELDRVVEEGMLNISIASVIEFKNGTSEGTAYIENVPSNKYVMKVTITLDSNNEVVYESGGIKPDSYINTIKLSKDLEAGTYPATATFTAYMPDTVEEVGQAAAKITIVVDE